MKSAVATGLDAADEAALMARVASGDNGDPMVALYQRYGSRIYGLGVRLLGDRTLAEEMVQETFVRLWRGAERRSTSVGGAMPGPWRWRPPKVIWTGWTMPSSNV